MSWQTILVTILIGAVIISMAPILVSIITTILMVVGLFVIARVLVRTFFPAE